MGSRMLAYVTEIRRWRAFRDMGLHCCRSTGADSNVEQNADAANTVEGREGAREVVKGTPAACKNRVVPQFEQLQVIICRKSRHRCSRLRGIARPNNRLV